MKSYTTPKWKFLAAVGLLALAVACGKSSGGGDVPSGSAPSADYSGPALALDKLSVDLGEVSQRQEGFQGFLVINKGDSPLKVGPVTIQVELGCDEAETVKGDTEVQTGEMILLPVKFGPHHEVGPHRILVQLSSNDPVRPLVAVPVSFTVVEAQQPAGGPRLSVDKESIDIGTVPFDWPLYEQFTLRNVGDAPLVLEGTPVVRVEEGC